MDEEPQMLEETKTKRARLVNLPEKLILCVDIGEEMAVEWASEPHHCTRLTALKIALKMFVRMKQTLNRNHSFAIVVLGERPRVVLDFEDDVEEVTVAIHKLEVARENAGCFDFSQLFSLFEAMVPKEDGEDTKITAVYRAIVFFGRSYDLPILMDTSPVSELDAFFMDVIYMHVKNTEKGAICQDIYDFLCGLESHAVWKIEYYVNITLSFPKLHQHVLMLLAHPAHRLSQETFLERLEYDVQQMMLSPTSQASQK